MRQSDLALILIRLMYDGEPHLLLNRHKKWGDWSLPGGHVEPEERGAWWRTAAREADEELAPLRTDVDFILSPLTDILKPMTWGPVESRSAGEPTMYRAQVFLLQFMREPLACIEQLPASEFQLVRESEIAHSTFDMDMSLVERVLVSVPPRQLSWIR
jgi:hypothetical protein